MSLKLPNLQSDLRAFPGIAPRVNVNHPAFKKIRLAAVASGANGINLLNGQKGTPSSLTGLMTAAGPGITGTGGQLQFPIPVTEVVTQETLAVIFVHGTQTVNHPIIEAGATLLIAAANTVLLDIGGSITTPALPTLIIGHTYFLALSCNTTAPRSTLVLHDLTTGQVSTATSTSALNTTQTAGGVYLTNNPGYRLNAVSVSSAPLTLPQLLEWANNPWSLWYDRSTLNVAALARRVVNNAPAPITGTLAATEAHDIASFSLTNVTGTNNATLAATEAHDVAHFVATNFRPVAPPAGGLVVSVRPANLRSFPGTAPKLSTAHVAYNQGIRLAAVPLGGGSVNLVNMGKGTFGTNGHVISTGSGPGMFVGNTGGTFGILYNPIIPGEVLSSRTYAAIFVAQTEQGQKALASPSNTSAESIAVVIPTTPTLFLNGSAVTLTPALPSLVVGRTYFFAASMQAGTPKQAVVLADLTSGEIFTATGAQTFTNATATIYAAPSIEILSQINAVYLSASHLTPGQLMEWAADPWGLWYDRATQNVAAMARRTGITNAASLAATEAHDIAHFTATNPAAIIHAILAATEASDRAAFLTAPTPPLFTGLPSAADYVLSGAGFSPPAPIAGAALRTYARVLQPDGVTLRWTEVTTDANGFNDWVFITAMIQEIKLNLGESPFWGNRGIPAFPSVVQQIAPDYYMTLIQQRYAPFFLNLTIARLLPDPNDRFDAVARPAPTYQINVTTHSGVQRAITV